MSRSTRSTLGLLVVAFAFSAFACGGGSGGGSGGSSGTGTGGASGGGTGGASGGGTPLAMSCNKFCVAEDKCNPDTTPTQCEAYTCPAAGEQNTKENLSATCKTAWIAWWDCLAKQTDPCDRPGTCTTQAAGLAGCNP